MSSHKRKRSASITSRASSQALAPDIINPHSHNENTIKQLQIAGLTDNDILPSNYIPQFPHRPIRPSHLTHSASSEDDSASDKNDHDASTTDAATTSPSSSSSKARQKGRRAKAMRDAQDQHLGLLTNVVLRALEEGDIARAKRAFGLVRRSEVRGKPVDLRRNGLWSLGAEVLMRDGEVPSSRRVEFDQEGAAVAEDGDVAQQQQQQQPPVRRWGAAANMPQLRAYLEELVRQYPYNRLHPNSISDLDFYPVLFGCEFYNTWAEHRLALERLEEDAEAWSDDIDMPEDPYEDGYIAEDDDHHTHQVHLTSRDRRLRQSKAELGLQALGTMHDVAKRMDTLMENAPYKTNVEMLRLRGMVALYVGDLGMPPPPRADDEEVEGRRIRDEERDRAGRLFRKMRDQGGRVDAFTEKWLEGGRSEDSGVDEDEDDMESAWSGLPVFSSLPMR
ncbi:hypothetical protein N0V93_004189 [Gnomoniopsis smithogilvyi]|uniref:Uncharacterized protein n=1 Tax=Gnomoniopsis smithogilvyi TaxID=1191159 RepID=A0A9W8YSD4_9PEZI|nr:hypothetical protein N0V93_004189 [Gnomoniopsis smithogilvyi]